MLSLSRRREEDTSGFKAVALAKLDDLDRKLAELSRVRAGLLALINQCPSHGSLQSCPNLGALSGEEA